MESSTFEISFARAVAALSTDKRYSLSPLVSPILGFTGLAGFDTEFTSEILSLVMNSARSQRAVFVLG
jgi:hypothetical protein